MIKHLHLSDVISQLDAQLHGQDVVIGNVSTDTRQLQPGDIFIALQGPNFNGNNFVASAYEKGASAAIVSQVQTSVPIPQLCVEDTLQALGKLAGLNRLHYSGKLIAVTGNSGKTTVKEMLSAILRKQGSVLATKGNLNNAIGAPLTLLQLTADQQFAIIELGASEVGEIAYTADLAKPDVSIITNVTRAHLGGFGTVEKIAQAKAEILHTLPTNGVAILNKNDVFFEYWQAEASSCHVLSFAIDDCAADLEATAIEPIPSGGIHFNLRYQAQVFPVELKLGGKHQVANALAAIAGAIALGVAMPIIISALAEVQPVQGRGNRLPGKKGAVLIDDTYNANPGSVKAAIDLLSLQPGMRILVLGDLAELGQDAEAIHVELGDYARKMGINHLLTVGSLSQHTVASFGECGHGYTDKQNLIDELQGLLTDETTVLVKGSRSAKMEDVVMACLDRNDGSN
ncbi:UDP-N-acetylmuramoyl-tripeptide--D-alanyl-D-alanine ligase [Zooshikella harenae]|uniref:UDP-N-acetylmuramoyl-tripeptide--D-alanyl-D-alanine ligase n=1 Tax=Zooshikella harenae TaxID=2827238 RepID=A0ABS5Z841_9GAMM|nr:UDP-N-acetylmuramoyl-tripeptide--D-alanyl-D-alanine ligase [Zooshikella harenae]MBU2710224.1 UDP-N-acetylmuramoyl-tripeptide--D-alanyl-D-alanine ligase [Zooshikella harenae]